MKIDSYGQQIYSETDVCDLYLTNPEIKLKRIITESDIEIANFIDIDSIPKFILHKNKTVSVPTFDNELQANWFIPDEYKKLDIAKYILDLCNTDEELQRVGNELILFQERNMFPLLQYLKFLVDTMRENNVVWGVGRGSSVSSYVLFLLGVHRINSLYYDLSIDEFLK